MNKIYYFYGNEKVKDIHAINRIYEGIDTPYDLYDVLSNIWCEQTCAPRMRDKYSSDNITLGQCSITAFLAQDIFGGEVYALPTDNGGVHCYNYVDGIIFDLTSEQFKEKASELVYDTSMLQERESEMHFAKEEKRLRYEYLKEQLRKIN